MSKAEINYIVVGIKNLYAGALGNGPLIWERDNRGELTGYATIAEALESVEELDDSVYTTDGNEAGRPEYYVLADNDAEYICTGRNGDGGNYEWEGVDCECPDADGNACGDCKACIDATIQQDIDWIKDHAVPARIDSKP